MTGHAASAAAVLSNSFDRRHYSLALFHMLGLRLRLDAKSTFSYTAKFVLPPTYVSSLAAVCSIKNGY